MPRSSSSSMPCTNAKVRQLMRRVTAHYDGQVVECGLKTSQYSLLATAAQLGPVTSCALAARLKTTASTLSRNLKPLIDAGFVTLEGGLDARSHGIVVTPAGLAKIAEARALWKVAQQELHATLGSDRVRALHELIDESLALLGPAGLRSARTRGER